MKKYKTIHHNMKYTLLLLTVLCIACSNPQNDLKKQIQEKEHALQADTALTPDKTKGNDMVKLYVEYADKYPDDTLSGTYLFKAGDIANKMRQPQQAVDLFGRVLKYKENSNLPLALFLMGFISETELNDKAKAKPYYESFIEKYPNHELADDVKANLASFNKTDEEIVRGFMIEEPDTLSAK
jgi:tetratricopeptide (TPR) repeat protein